MAGNRGKPAVCSLLFPVMVWLVTGSAVPSILTEAFTSGKYLKLSKRERKLPSLSIVPKAPPSQTTKQQQQQQAVVLAAILLDEIEPSIAITTTTTTTTFLAHQPPLDIISVDPGQAVFWCTILHWILWDKTTTAVALTFDIFCIVVTLWDGTVRAAM